MEKSRFPLGSCQAWLAESARLLFGKIEGNGGAQGSRTHPAAECCLQKGVLVQERHGDPEAEPPHSPAVSSGWLLCQRLGFDVKAKLNFKRRWCRGFQGQFGH